MRLLKIPLRYALLIALLLVSVLLFSPPGFSQTAPQTSVNKTVGETATLSWNAVTGYTNGTVIPSGVVVTYNIYETPQVSGACVFPTAPTVTGITALTYTTPAFTAPGTYCYAPSATANGVESAKGNIATAIVANPSPNSPAGTSIQ